MYQLEDCVRDHEQITLGEVISTEVRRIVQRRLAPDRGLPQSKRKEASCQPPHMGESRPQHPNNLHRLQTAANCCKCAQAPTAIWPAAGAKLLGPPQALIFLGREEGTTQRPRCSSFIHNICAQVMYHKRCYEWQGFLIGMPC